MKTNLRLILRLLAILLSGAVAGFALLLIVYALPVAPMAEHVRLSIPALDGRWGSGEGSYEQLAEGYQSTQLDNSTDSSMLLTAVYAGDERLLTRAVQARRYTSDGYVYQTLFRYGETGAEGLSSAPSSRYWHGYLVLLKPLLLLFSYMDIRVLLAVGQGLLLAATVAGLCRRGLARLAPAFALSMILVMPSVTAYSLQFSTALCVCLGVMLALLRVPVGRLRGQRLYRLFLLSGMLTSYFDYLTYPVVTLGMPLVLCAFLTPEATARATLRRFAACAACWALGYFGMWALKWPLALAFSDEAWFLPNLWAKITERSDAAIGYGNALRAILGVYAKRAYAFVALLTALAYACALLRRKRRGLPGPFHDEGASARAPALLLTALLPFVWYLCTQNHSYNHAFFTARALAVTAFALASLLSLPAGALRAAPRPVSQKKE